MTDKLTTLCENCTNKCNLPCAALSKLFEVYEAKRDEQRNEILQELKKELDILDAEISQEMKNMADMIIDKYIMFIREFDIRVGYVSCNEAKKDRQGKIVNAECIKIKPWMKAYLPYDYIIVFYEFNIMYFNSNQRKILMYHELEHIDMGERGLRIRHHDIEDFRNIVDKFGTGWSDYDANVPDILAGE
jgi:hypothetical protein